LPDQDDRRARRSRGIISRTKGNLDLVLGAAGLAYGLSNQPPREVAALIERTARRMHAPYDDAAELRKAAEIQVAAAQERVQCMNQAGGLREINTQYKAYRQAQIARAERTINSWSSDTPRQSSAISRRGGNRFPIEKTCSEANGKRTAVLRPCCME
jgi:hypothetical protein